MSVTTTRSVVTITTGEAGSGKTYSRCSRFLVDHFLKDQDGKHYSNFPLGVVPETHSIPPAYEGETFIERIARECEKKWGADRDSIMDRVHVIPANALHAWEQGDSGPWDWFRDKDLTDAHITIDEIHNFMGPNTTASVRKKWQQWIGELRHQGAKLEVISQARAKVPKELRAEAGTWIALKNTETDRDPFFRIQLGDWYELGATYSREYRAKFVEEYHREATGTPAVVDRRIYPIDPAYFALYDSFSAPQRGGKAAKGTKREYERRGFVGVHTWFLRRNAFRIIPKLLIVAFFVWLVMGGGAWVVRKGIEAMGTVGGKAAASSKDAAVEDTKPETPAMETPGLEERPIALGAITDRSVVLGDGVLVSLGERVPLGHGRLSGRTLDAVDFAKRRAVFQGGVVVPVGSLVGGLQSGTDAGAGSGVPAVVRGAQAAGGGSGAAAGRGTRDGQSLGQRDPAGEPRTPTDRSGAVDRLRSAFGTTVGDVSPRGGSDR
jgi:hypothetical protein